SRCVTGRRQSICRFFFHDTATTELYTLSLHDALPIYFGGADVLRTLTQTTLSGVNNVTAVTGRSWSSLLADWSVALWADGAPERSEEHTSELQSRENLVCRLLLEKKKNRSTRCEDRYR